MFHDPAHIGCSEASDKIVVVISCIIVPKNIVNRKNTRTVQCIQYVLIGKNQFLKMIFRKTENFCRIDFVRHFFKLISRTPEL